MELKLLIKALLLFPAILFCQSTTELFPGNLNVQPYIANFLELRVGVQFQLNNNELRLDIGNSMDIIHINQNDNSVLSFGADFFTYTLLRGEKDFHFPVDAVDYLFGINSAFKTTINGNELGARLRLSHISAHFVDGHFDHQSLAWRNGREPRVYSREFIEFIPYYRLNDFRFYMGYTYIFHVDPTYLGKDIFHLGGEYFCKDFPVSNLNPFVGYDMKLAKIDKYAATNSLTVGLKYGFAKGKGFSIFYSYFQGKSIHGEYFDYNKNYSSVGFNLDF